MENDFARRGRKNEMKLKWIVMAVTFVLGFSGAVAAQSPDFTQVTSPFQDEFEYSVNTDLRPGVEVDGVRWTRFGVHTKEGKEIVADKEIPVTVEFDFVNQESSGARILVIVLFEDERGTPLDRIECNPVRASSERRKESIQKFKLAGNVLLAVRKVYLFCEVER